MLNLLSESSNCKFATRKWNICNDQSNAKYDIGMKIIYNTEEMKSDHCDCSDAYILERGDIITIAHNNPTPVSFTNCAPFTKCITKIEGTRIDDAEDLDLIIPVNHLIKYKSSYSDTTGSLRFYSEDEVTNFDADIVNSNAFKSFEYKIELFENTVGDGNN